VITSKIRWVGHQAHIVNNRNANLEESDHLEELGVDGKMILKWILHSMGGHELDVSTAG
jgi:hypothetical protein